MQAMSFDSKSVTDRTNAPLADGQKCNKYTPKCFGKPSQKSGGY